LGEQSTRDIQKGTARFSATRLPHSVAYGVLTEDEIEIIAVVHGARKPGWWTRRLRRPEGAYPEKP
jgi:hypothetical protein